MMIWHLPQAISGQAADLPRGELRFSPVLAPPFSLPVFLSGRTATLSVTEFGVARLTLASGDLFLSRLEVWGQACPHTPVQLLPGHSLEWSVTLPR
mmetsp:Transcript_44953/g.105987  ORF Transcript_44953/g.105987 Transcript_44953/m.105987 type:complete len:96 (-) Transcript_44953:258-545(-)